MNIVPAILSDSFLTVQNEIEAVRFSSLIEAVHIDIIDGQFVDALTVTPIDLTVADFEPLKVDFHFMTEEPMDFVNECEGLKDYLPIRRLIGQVERMSHQKDFLYEVKLNNWQAALALDLFTPFEAIDDDVWPDLDFLMLMGVEAGAQGKKLHPHLFEKLQEIPERFPVGHQFKIIVDGGVKHDNIRKFVELGAEELVIGSEIWHSESPEIEIERLYRQA